MIGEEVKAVAKIFRIVRGVGSLKKSENLREEKIEGGEKGFSVVFNTLGGERPGGGGGGRKTLK